MHVALFDFFFKIIWPVLFKCRGREGEGGGKRFSHHDFVDKVCWYVFCSDGRAALRVTAF